MKKTPINIFALKVSDLLTNSEYFLPFLTADESYKSREFINHHLERNYIVHKAFERIILQHYIQNPTLNINYGKYGKPFVDNSNACPIFYSKSHSGDWIVLAISTIELGIDIEIMTSESNEDLVPMVYNERDHINFGTTEDFFTVWSLKEAYSKLIGMGLNFDLSVCHIRSKKDDFLIYMEDELLARAYKIDIDSNYSCYLTINKDNISIINLTSSRESIGIINNYLTDNISDFGRKRNNG